MDRRHPDRDMIALGIRQPWAELIVRGIKTIEVRSQDTAQRGRIYIYASKKLSDIPEATAAATKHKLDLQTLPKGLIVGTIELVDSFRCRSRDSAAACVPRRCLKDQFGWRLSCPQRLPQPLQVRFLPYGVWFYPWKRKQRPV